jgi:hypothetical protein
MAPRGRKPAKKEVVVKSDSEVEEVSSDVEEELAVVAEALKSESTSTGGIPLSSKSRRKILIASKGM